MQIGEFAATRAAQTPDEPSADTAGGTRTTEPAHAFNNQIAPLLALHCLECHDSATKKGGLDLSRRERALAGGESGVVLVPGKSAESLLWKHVESGEMPQNRPALSDDEKRRLQEWIDAGAEWTLEVIDSTDLLDSRRAAGTWVQRLTVTEYIDTVRAAAGVDIERDALRLLPRDVRADGFSNTAYNLPIDLAHVEAYSQLARLIVARMDVPEFVREHAPSEAVARALAVSGGLDREHTEVTFREAIDAVGKWLLRGPLDEHELQAYLGVARAVGKEGGTFTEGMTFIIESMLQSPRFLFRIEDQRGDGAARPVGAYELASRLSYILWGGPPDRELDRAAEAGELADRDRMEAQVARMLEDPRAVRRSLQFIRDWLDLDRLAGLRPSPERFPQWNEQLAADMRDETLAFFEDVVWKQRRPLWDLLNAEVTWATPRLAQHYDLDPDAGERAGVSEFVSIAGIRSADPPARVSHGLQTLYTFEDVTGGVVRDTSGAGDPLDLMITDPSAVRSSGTGLAINTPTIIAARLPPGRLIDAVQNTNAFTLEAWITPANTSQSGPARIVTFSVDPSGRNFTLGQEGDRYEVRFRTTATDANGEPALGSPGGLVEARLMHVVFTRDAEGETKLFIDADERAAGISGGDLSNWEPRGRDDRRKPEGFRLALANELTRDRPWQGTLHLVAVYDRALAPQEVRQNHEAGPRRTARASGPDASDIQLTSGRVTTDVLALYTFGESSGRTVRDTSAAGEPLDLTIDDLSTVTWDAGRLRVNGPVLIAAAAPPKRLMDAVKRSKSVTLEAWITPADAEQEGPARILTLSAGVLQRNFTLGQQGDMYDVRFRGSATDPSGLPSLSSAGGTVQSRPTHVVYTRDAGGTAKLYIDGQEHAARDVPGDLSNWDDGFRLALANETSQDRPWRGTYDLVALYSRALSADEVHRNHAAGPSQDGQPAPAVPVDRARQDLQALYSFDEGAGSVLRDTSGAGDPLELRIEDAAAAEWLTGGITLTGRGLVASVLPPKRLIAAVKRSNALTLEVWLTPGETEQSGPARIVTLSSGIGQRNFTLGQDGSRYDVRFRTTKTDANGQPSLASENNLVQLRPTRVTYTRNAAGQSRLYVDGEPAGTLNAGGDLSNWGDDFRLAVGNETTRDRPWRGTLHRIAIYSRELSPEEVRFGSGPARYDLASVPARGGLLTQGSVLTIGGDEASMVARGLFVLHELLSSRVGNPPPCVDTSPVPTKPGLSQRGAAETRIANSACTGCHSRFEPLAFGLERFDGIGGWSEVDHHGNPLCEDGEILFPGAERPVPYTTSAELMDLLAGSERVRLALTRKVTQFALGRPLVEADTAVVDRIHAEAQARGGTYAATVTAIVLSDLVRMTGTE